PSRHPKTPPRFEHACTSQKPCYDAGFLCVNAKIYPHYFVDDPLLFYSHRALIVSLAAHHELPAVYFASFAVRDRGLISYGPDSVHKYRQAAGYVDRSVRLCALFEIHKAAGPMRQLSADALGLRGETATTTLLRAPKVSAVGDPPRGLCLAPERQIVQ